MNLSEKIPSLQSELAALNARLSSLNAQVRSLHSDGSTASENEIEATTCERDEVAERALDVANRIDFWEQKILDWNSDV
jgi:chromosome segregation ATPase